MISAESANKMVLSAMTACLHWTDQDVNLVLINKLFTIIIYSFTWKVMMIMPTSVHINFEHIDFVINVIHN